MIFSDQVITEITVPNNVPFLPGFDVIGIGTEIPVELTAYGIDAAIIFYTDTWSTAVTIPTVKFFFIGVRGNALVSGYAYSNDPSTIPVATVIRTEVNKLNQTTAQGLTQWAITSSKFPTTLAQDINRLAQISEAPTPFDGGGVFATYDALDNRLFQIQPDPTSPSHGANIFVIDGATQNVILEYFATAEVLKFVTSSHGFGQWVACTYANGWSAKAAPGFGQRSGVGVIRLPDGTVHMSGVANVGTGTPGTYCVQLPAIEYWPNYGKTFTCFQEASPDYVSFTLNSGNGALTVAGSTSATAAVHFEASWVVPL